MLKPLITLLLLRTVKPQILDVQDLSDNHGYLPIKIKDVDIVDYYIKVIHVINTTKYIDTANMINDNIQKLANTYSNVTPLLESIGKSMDLCRTKISNLIPKFRQKRGLINIIGKGLKYLTGTMDNDDEENILNHFSRVDKFNNETSTEIDQLTYLSTTLSNKVSNITAHINDQQHIIQTYIHRFKKHIGNRILNLEDETTFLENIFRINNDLNLLTNHVDEIGHVIFNSRLGVIPSDILTKEEYELMDKIESYLHTNISVKYRHNLVILTLQIPRFLNETFSEVLLEPIPNEFNRSLALKDNTFLIHKNETYNTDTFEYKKLRKVKDSCIQNIVKSIEPNCKMSLSIIEEEREIYPGLLIFKNFKSKIETNCNTTVNFEKIKTFLIKFENCNVKTEHRSYENYKINVKEMFVIEKFMLKVKENNESLPDLHLDPLKFNDTITLINRKLLSNNMLNISSNVSALIVIISIIILIYIRMNKRIYILSSSEPRTNGGGVTATPIFTI